MPSDPGSRLAGALRGLRPDRAATEAARAALLDRFPDRTRSRGGALPAAFAAALVVAGAGVAAGELPRPFTPERPARQSKAAAPGHGVVLQHGLLRVSPGAGGAWTRPATAVERSPAGLFLAYGERGALVAAELDGDVRWRQPVAGTVVAIDWAPYPTYIAYIVRRGSTHDLHVIWANGLHDRVIARGVAAAALSWRKDTGAVAFTWSDGRAAVWEREPDRVVTRGTRR